MVFRVPWEVLWGVKLRGGLPVSTGIGHRRRGLFFSGHFFWFSFCDMKNPKGRPPLSLRSKEGCSATSTPAGFGVCGEYFSLPHVPKGSFWAWKRLLWAGAIGHGRQWGRGVDLRPGTPPSDPPAQLPRPKHRGVTLNSACSPAPHPPCSQSHTHAKMPPPLHNPVT